MTNRKTTENNETLYTYYGKKYKLVEEVVKGGCQGCAFYDRVDCSNKNINRTSICTKEHKIFQLYINSLDK